MSQQVVATTRSAAGMPTGKLAVWWVIASEIPIFGGLICSYLMNRMTHPEWGPMAAGLNIWAGSFNTLVLLTSSLMAMLATAAANRGDGKLAALRLRLAALGGVIFLCVKGWEWSVELTHGHTPMAGGYFGYYFTLLGLHGLHVAIGTIILLIIASQVSQNKHMHRPELIGLYWHFVDVVWFFLFSLFYIIR